ncbi:hypothetical protein AKJ50_00505 [candidate division MSBL1 archaeon SCGC-AAA382A13]|uniref:Uncharacterized protein n=1 Tax=candidate division MSBL1 archaeon SCGC-AAA382A13 TaxID=1698279 RepID=A0A133VGN5_9EURY|nr:hypothetical protein AKJ50_00505 [candidate division MSBL1 archaeon SCGC-AAA382A13]
MLNGIDIDDTKKLAEKINTIDDKINRPERYTAMDAVEEKIKNICENCINRAKGIFIINNECGYPF